MGLSTEYKEKKKQLESEIARYKSLIDATEEPIRVARSTQHSHASAVESEKFKKNGNYFFIAAGILLILLEPLFGKFGETHIIAYVMMAAMVITTVGSGIDSLRSLWPYVSGNGKKD